MKNVPPPSPTREGPTHLYKFRGVNEYTRAIFRNQKLHFAHADSFNDPFDCLPKLSLDSTMSELKRYLADIHRKRFPGVPRRERLAERRRIIRRNGGMRPPEMMALFERGLKQVRDITGVLSLTEQPDHMLQWAHYADSHRGIALRFSPRPGDGFFEWALPVVYQADRPTINLVRDAWWEVHERALLTKADFWSYEKEWRIAVRKFAPGTHKFPRLALDGIILGARTPVEHQNEIRQLAAHYDVEWMRAEVEEDKFAIKIVPFVWEDNVGKLSNI